MTTTRYLFIRTQNVGDKFSFCFPLYIYIYMQNNAAVEEGENTSAGITLNTLTDQSPSSKDSKL